MLCETCASLERIGLLGVELSSSCTPATFMGISIFGPFVYSHAVYTKMNVFRANVLHNVNGVISGITLIAFTLMLIPVMHWNVVTFHRCSCECGMSNFASFVWNWHILISKQFFIVPYLTQKANLAYFL